MGKRKRYTKEHKELFLAIFDGSSDINKDGKVVVNGKEWDWTDSDVQYFVHKARHMKMDMSNYIQKELKSMFGGN